MKAPNKYRIRTGFMASDDSYGNNGRFLFKQKKNKPDLDVIASDQIGWEHVSVSTQHRTPTWEEMCFIKNKFWGPDDCVIQYHPPKSDYINNHSFCLHLWKPVDIKIPMPPKIMVGV
jgi:hypothetical protein